jgi:hypothetical protein
LAEPDSSLKIIRIAAGNGNAPRCGNKQVYGSQAFIGVTVCRIGIAPFRALFSIPLKKRRGLTALPKYFRSC